MLNKYILLIAAGLIFGSQFVATHYALQGLSALDISMFRLVFGAVFMFIVVALFFRHEKQQRTKKLSWWTLALVAFFEMALPTFLLPWGQLYLKSVVTSVLISTVPIFAVVIGPIIAQSETFRWRNILSVIVGFVGVVVLINPGSGGHWLTHLIPELSILGAAASWAIGLAMLKNISHQPPMRLTRNLLLTASIEVLIVWLFVGHPFAMHVTLLPLLCSVLLGIFTSGFGYIIYLLLIRRGGVNFAAFCNYLVPIVGCLMAVAFLHEHLTVHAAWGFGVIMMALAVHSWQDYRLAKKTLR